MLLPMPSPECYSPHTTYPCSYVVVEEQLCAELDSRAAEIRAHAWSVTTWKTKCSQWKKYINFCAKSASPILPTSVQTMCRYIVYLSEDLKYVTIDNYVSAVIALNAHYGYDVSKIRANFVFRSTMSGLRRILGG